MADYSRWSFQEQSANPAQPSGQRQAAQRYAAQAPGGGFKDYAAGARVLQPWLPESYRADAQSWWSGRNLEGTANGWSNDFMRESLRQQRRYLDRAANSGRASDAYDWLDPEKNEDATGVATWTSGDVEAGDVWENGEYKGNLYRMYSEEDADLMLSAFLFDGRQQERLNGADDPAKAYRDAVQGEIDARSDHARYGPGAERFRDDVSETNEAIRSAWGGSADDILAIGASAPLAAAATAAGAAALGFSWTGPGALVAAGAAAVIAGAGAWMNRDQFTETAARAWEVTDRAKQQHGVLDAAFTGLSEFSQLAMLGMSPFTNTVQGLYDGFDGDGVSDWYAMDPETGEVGPNGVWKAVNIAAMVGDAFAQFSSPVARAAYMSTMGLHTTGRAGQMATMDAVWNDSRGDFDELQGGKEYLANIGSIGIDLVQIGVAGQITRAAAASRQMVGRPDMAGTGADWWKKGGDWVERRMDARALRKKGFDADDLPDMHPQTINGIRFFLDDKGDVITSRLTMQMIAPSEFVRWLPTGWKARNMRAAANGAPTTDDLYAAALQLTTGGNRFTDALMNAYGEGVEEAVQAWLDPMATGETARWGDVAQAALMGAASGFGMGLGTVNQRAKSAEVQKSRASWLFRRRNDLWGMDDKEFQELFDAQYDGATEAEKQRMAIASREEAAEIEEIFRTMQDFHRMNREYSSPVGMLLAQDARKGGFEDALSGANPAVEATLQLMGMTSKQLIGADFRIKESYESHMGVSSAWQVVQNLRNMAAAFRAQTDGLIADRDKLVEQLKGLTGDAAAAVQAQLDAVQAKLDDLGDQADTSRAFVEDLMVVFEEYRSADTRDAAHAAIDRINDAIRAMWASDDIRDRRAVELVTSRHPIIDTGSGGILMPQASKGLSDLGINGTLHTFQGGLKVLGGDHDGDARVTLNMLYLEPQMRADLRAGFQYIKEVENEQGLKRWKVQGDPPDGEIGFLRRFGRHSGETSLAHDAIARALDDIVIAFRDRYTGVLDIDAMDNALERFKVQVWAAHPDARFNLIEGLFNSSPDAAQKLVRRGDESRQPEFLWMSQEISTGFESAQREIAHLQYSTEPPASPGDPVRHQEDQNFIEGRDLELTVDIAAAMSVLFSADAVRNAQHVHYTPFLHAAVKSAGLEATGLVSATEQELARLYQALGDNDSASDLEKVAGRDVVQNRVVQWLSKMISQMPEGTNVPALMMILAQTSVRDIQQNKDTGEWTITDGQITLGQLLLRRSIEIERRQNPGLPKDSDLAKKLNRLEGLTRPQGKHSYSASLAMLELFGSFRLIDLIGAPAQYLGANATMNQLVTMIQGMDSTERERHYDAWKTAGGAYSRHREQPNPPYGVEFFTEAELSPYTVIVDAVIATGRTKIKALRERNGTSEEHAQKGFRDFTAQMEQWHKQFGELLEEQLGHAPSDLDILRNVLENVPGAARLVADLVPEAARMAAFTVEGGRPYLAPWVERMLLERNPAKAAVMYFVHSKIAEYNAMGAKIAHDLENISDKDLKEMVESARIPDNKKGRIRSRYLQSLYVLANRPDGGHELARFLRASYTADSTDDLFRQINEENPDWKGPREDLLPWFDDVALFEVDPRDIWTSNLPGTLQREKLEGWGSKIGMVTKRSMEAIVARESEIKILTAMKVALDAQENPAHRPNQSQDGQENLNRDNAYENLDLLQMALDNRRMFPDGMGPAARMQLMTAVQDVLIRMHDKGKADARIEPWGVAHAVTMSFGNKQGAFSELDHNMSHDLFDVLQNPTKLVEGPVRIMFDDGQLLELDLSTKRGILEALLDDRTNALAKAIIMPTVRDIDTNNQIQLYADVDDTSDFVGLLKQQRLAHLFNGGKRPSLEQAHRYISLVEAGVRKNAEHGTTDEQQRAYYPIQHMINDLLVAYSHGPWGTSSQKESMRDTIVIDVAHALQQLNGVAEDKLVELKRMLKATMVSRMTGSDAELRRLDKSAEMAVLEQQMVERIVADYTSRLEELEDRLTDPDLDQAQEDALQSEYDVVAEAMRAAVEGVHSFSTFEDLGSTLNSFRIPWDDPAAVGLAQKRLLEYISDRNRLNRFRDKGRMDLIHRIRRVASAQPGSLYDLESITQEEWDEIVTWAATAKMADSATRSGSSVALEPVSLDMDSIINRYYDWSMAYLVDPLFDQQVLAVAKEIGDRVNDYQRTDEEVGSQILATLLSPKRIGAWTDRIPVESMKFRKALEGAPVKMGVARAGIDPKLMAEYVGAGWLSLEKPRGDHLSTFEMTGTTDIPVHEMMKAFPAEYIKLQNHFVRNITLKAPGLPTGQLDITDIVGKKNFHHPEVEASDYYTFSFNDLQEALQKLADQYEFVDYDLEIEYVDVDKRPPTREYANSIYFDGVGRMGELSTGAGPLASMVFGLDALSKLGQQGPLDYAARNGWAFAPYTLTSFEDVRTREKNARTVGEYVTAKVMHLMKQKYETGMLLASDTPAIHKLVKMRTVVRISDDGLPNDAPDKKWTYHWADEIIQREATGETFDYGPGKVEIIPLSDNVARTLWGQSGFSGTSEALQQPTLNLSTMDPFPSLDATRLAELGLQHLGDVPKSAGSTRLAQVVLPLKATMDPAKGVEIKTRYQERLRHWTEEHEQLTNARTISSREGKTNLDIRQINSRAFEQFAKMNESEAMVAFMHRMRIPYEGLQDNARQLITDHLIQQIQKLALSYTSMVWTYQAGTGYSLAEGLVGDEQIETRFGKMGDYRPVFGDMVLIDLGSIMTDQGGDPEAAFAKAQNVIREFASRGITVMLGSEGGHTDLRGTIAQWMARGELGYEAVAGSTHVFAPITDTSRLSPQQRMLRSADTSVKVFNGRGATLGLVTDWWPNISENMTLADVRNDPVWTRAQNLILPTSVTASGTNQEERFLFNEPVEGMNGINQRSDVTATLLQELNSAEGFDRLVEILDEGRNPKNVPIYKEHRDGIDPGVRDTRDALNVLKETLQANLWPVRTNGKLVPGDIYPLVTNQGEILLARVGYDFPGAAEIVRQIREARSEHRPTIAGVKSKLAPNHTVPPPPFTIEKIVPEAQRGLVLQGEWDLAAASKEFFVGPGYKAGLVPLPENVVMPIPMVDKGDRNRTTVTRLMSSKSIYGKQAVEGLVDNFSDAFTVFGMDFREDILNTFFGTPSKPRSEQEFRSQWNDAKYLLDRWAKQDHGITSEQISRGMDVNGIYAEVIEKLNREAAGLFGNSWQPLELDDAGMDVSSEITMLILSTLMAPGVQTRHVVSTSGLLTLDDVNGPGQIVRMPTLFTDALADHSRPDLRQELFRRMNAGLPTNPDGTKAYKLETNFDFYAAIEHDGKVRWEPNQLMVILPVPAAENAEIYARTQAAASRTGVTQHVVQTLNAALGGSLLLEQGEMGLSNAEWDVLYGSSAVAHFDQGTDDVFYRMLTRLDKRSVDFTEWERMLPMEAGYHDQASRKVGQYQQRIDKFGEGWDKDDRATAETYIKKIIGERGLNIQHRGPEVVFHVDYLVRQFVGRPGPSTDQTDYEEIISGKVYRQAAEMIWKNVQAKRNPLHGGAVPLPHRDLLELIFVAQRGRNPRWAPLAKEGGDQNVVAVEWEDWVHSIIGQVLESDAEFHTMFTTDLDGFFHTYQGTIFTSGQMPISMEVAKRLRLINKDTNDMIMSVDPGNEAVLNDPILLDAVEKTLDALTGHSQVFGEEAAYAIETSALQEQLRRQEAWLAKKNLPKQAKSTVRNHVAEGEFFKESVRDTNALYRNLINLSITMRLLNPAIFVSGYLEVPVRNVFEHVTNVLTGRHIGTGGGALAEAGLSKFNQDEVKALNNLAGQMGKSSQWLAVLYDEMTYQSLVAGTEIGQGKVSKGLERSAAFTAKAISDPRYGMLASSIAKRYIEAAWEYFHLTDSAITVEQFVRKMSRDPLWLQKEQGEEGRRAHRMGMNRVAQVRTTKQTVLGKSIMAPIDWLTTRPSAAANVAGHALKLPFMFTRFNANALTTMTGMGGVDQAIAMFFDGRTKPKFLQRAKKAADGELGDEQFDLSDIIETIDLQRTFIRSGVTQTMLMTLGMMAGNLGLDGEDEEEKRRRRLAEYLRVPHYLDPAEAQNSFTYSDAIFLDSIPVLNTMFKDETGRSVIAPHWIMRQFTSPIIGMNRFFATGDVREIGWGFLDAFSAIPYSVARLWDEADVTAGLLMEEAKMSEADFEGAPQANSKTTQFLINIVGVYEKLLIENSFVNSLRNGSDQWDRNPWLHVEMDNGVIQREDGTETPKAETALESYVDEDGNVQNAYMTRSGVDGQLHQFAENNATFALIASLFTGMGDSTFLRRNMVVKEREIRLPPTEKEMAEATLMAIYMGYGGQQNLTLEELIRMRKQFYIEQDVWYDQSTVEKEARAIYDAHQNDVGALSIISDEGEEILTTAGADAVLTSLANGVLEPGDPALAGITISQETRDAIAGDWMENLIQEGINLGLGEEAARYRARRFWYGDSAAGTPGIRAIIYDKRIPTSNVVKYNQLNTTYVIGPDGKPWATPFKRTNLLQSLGIPVPHTTHEAGTGLGLDDRGNIVDEVLGINTGLHAIERKPFVADVEPNDEVLEKALAKTYTGRPPSGSGGYGGRYYGSGGGGYSGGGYLPAMRNLPGGTSPRGDDIPFINTDNPFIRRARVSRQRISVNRGRLKQWQ